MARRSEVEALYDERFCRMWEFYLVLCEIGFRRRTNMVFQLQLTRQLDAVPTTRDYMVAAQRRVEPGARPARACPAFRSGTPTRSGGRRIGKQTDGKCSLGGAQV